MKQIADKGLSLRLGALAPNLSSQLGDLGLSKSQIQAYQDDADAITRLVVRGYMGETIARNMRLSLMRKIERAVK